MIETVQHPPVKRKYQRQFWIDSCSVDIGPTQSTVTGELAVRIASQLNKWLEDGMLIGTATGTFKKYPNPE